MPDHEAEQFSSCTVCGRTILRGERVVEYLTPDGESMAVCALCRQRAEAEGWVRADSPAARRGPGPQRRRRGEGLRERGQALRQRGQAIRGRAREYAERLRPIEQPEAEEAPAPPAPAEAAPAPERGPEPAPEPEPNPRPAPDTPERRVRRAVQHFNDSEESRVVAGLIRSLGEPQAAVRDLAGKPPKVDVIVAWELSWYRWEVGSKGEDAQILEVAKGAELSELGGDEPDWNASVDGDGKLRWRESS